MNIWILLIVISFFVITLFFVFFVFFKQLSRHRLANFDKIYIQKHWANVIAVHSFNPAKAVLDADKILDYALSKHGFSGSLGEKLKKSGPRFSDLNSVWAAHKLRNHIAHELSDLSSREAKDALANFKKALNDLGAGLQ